MIDPAKLPCIVASIRFRVGLADMVSTFGAADVREALDDLRTGNLGRQRPVYDSGGHYVIDVDRMIATLDAVPEAGS
jgi:hypothetical protein